MDSSRQQNLLINENEEFRNLKQQHRELEMRLEEIRKKSILGATEEIEFRDIKKRKLLLKDRMEKIARKFNHRRQGWNGQGSQVPT